MTQLALRSAYTHNRIGSTTKCFSLYYVLYTNFASLKLLLLVWTYIHII